MQAGKDGFQGCQDGRVYFEGRDPLECNTCINDHGRTYIYFCKTI